MRYSEQREHGFSDSGTKFIQLYLFLGIIPDTQLTNTRADWAFTVLDTTAFII